MDYKDYISILPIAGATNKDKEQILNDCNEILSRHIQNEDFPSLNHVTFDFHLDSTMIYLSGDHNEGLYRETLFSSAELLIHEICKLTGQDYEDWDIDIHLKHMQSINSCPTQLDHYIYNINILINA